MTANRVSVIMPTFNRAPMIGESIQSVLDQTHREVELIVIDDGSTDDTEAVVARYGDRVRYAKVENGGKPRALNIAMAMTTGDFIVVLDDDDVLLKNCIERHLSAIASDDSLGLTYSDFYRGGSGPDGKLAPATLFRAPDLPRDAAFPALLESMYFVHQGCLVRRQCYREIGGFDPELRRAEDYDVLLRLLHKYPVAHVPEPLLIVRTHVGARGTAHDRFDAAERAIRDFGYLGRVYRRLHESLELREYLPRSVVATDPNWARLAAIKRIAVMMRKGIWDLAAEDLRRLAAGGLGAAPLSAEEVRVLGIALRNPPALIDLSRRPEERASLAAALRAPPLAALRPPLLRGLYWGLREVAADRLFAQSGRLALEAVKVFGVTEVVRLAWPRR